MEPAIRIFLIDDHRLFRQGVRLLLKSAAHLIIVGEASDGADAARTIEAAAPNMIIVDVHLPDCDGIELGSRLLAKLPAAKLVFLSSDSSFVLARRALDGGASGYLLKDGSPQDLVQGIEAAWKGGMALAPAVAAELVRDYCARGTLPAAPVKKQELSARETEVLKFMAQGLRNKEIADHLNVGVKTVETYRRRLFVKLGCSSVAEVVRFAIRTGLIAA